MTFSQKKDHSILALRNRWIPGKSSSTCKIKVISICGKRIAANNVLNVLILWIWEEMSILQEIFRAHKKKDIVPPAQQTQIKMNVTYRMTRFEFRRCPQSQYATESIWSTKHPIPSKG